MLGKHSGWDASTGCMLVSIINFEFSDMLRSLQVERCQAESGCLHTLKRERESGWWLVHWPVALSKATLTFDTSYKHSHYCSTLDPYQMKMPSMTLKAGLCYRCWAGSYHTSARGAFQRGQKRRKLETRTFSKCWLLKDETVLERRRWVRLVRCFKRDGCGGGVGGLGGQDGRWQEFCWRSRRRQRIETRIRNNYRSSTFLRVCSTTARMVAVRPKPHQMQLYNQSEFAQACKDKGGEEDDGDV